MPPTPESDGVAPGRDVATVGVKRTAFGHSGRPLTVLTNHFEVHIPKQAIYHYDGALNPLRPVLLTNISICPTSLYVLIGLPTLHIILPTS